VSLSRGRKPARDAAIDSIRRLTDADIDECFAKAADTIREVREQLRGCEGIPASARGLVLR